AEQSPSAEWIDAACAGSALGEEAPNLARLLAELLQRIDDPAEFDPVRRLACEVLGRLPVAVAGAAVGSRLSAARSRHDGAALARTYLFAACCAAAAHDTAVEALLHTVVPPTFEWLLASSDDDNEDLAHVRRACVDLFSLLLAIHARRSAAAATDDRRHRPLIVDVTSAQTASAVDPTATAETRPPHPDGAATLADFERLLLRLLDPRPEVGGPSAPAAALEELAGAPEARLKTSAAATAVGNSVTVAVRRMAEAAKAGAAGSGEGDSGPGGGGGGGGSGDGDDSDAFRAGLRCIGRRFGPVLVRVASERGAAAGSSAEAPAVGADWVVAAACLQ
ncbi:hypothetical protein HK405_013232, partial [Cladochytrium tenue]